MVHPYYPVPTCSPLTTRATLRDPAWGGCRIRMRLKEGLDISVKIYALFVLI